MNEQTLFDGLQLFCIVLAGTSLVSMMAVFIGASHPALGPLLAAQLLGSVLAAVILVVVLTLFVAAFGTRRGALELWRRLPGWLLFVVASLVSLVLAGELSYLLIHTVAERATSIDDHVPLLAALFGSLAWCAVHALASWRAPEDGVNG